MGAKSASRRAKRKAERLAAKSQKNRIANQPDGMPQGKHLQGFKGTKVDAVCFCGGCNPASQAGKNKVVYL